RAGAVKGCPFGDGRSGGRVAQRTVQLRCEVSLLPEGADDRHGPGGHGPPTHRHHRRQAQARGRGLDLQPVARDSGRQSRSQQERVHSRARARRVCGLARTWRIRSGEDSRAEDRAMMLLALAVLPGVFWEGAPSKAPALRESGVHHIFVAPDQVEAWKKVEDIVAEAVDLNLSMKLKSPAVNYRFEQASASRVPWIDANGWQFLRR